MCTEIVIKQFFTLNLIDAQVRLNRRPIFNECRTSLSPNIDSRTLSLASFYQAWLHSLIEMMELTMRSQALRSVVVVVDDDLTYLQTVGLMLKKMGFAQVKLFSNAFDASDWLENEATDLIVSDWDMPVMTGFELLENARANPKTKDIPFIGNTGNLSESYWKQAIACGASEFLFKPFSFFEFRDSVHLVLDMHSSTATRRAHQKKLAS